MTKLYAVTLLNRSNQSYCSGESSAAQLLSYGESIERIADELYAIKHEEAYKLEGASGQLWESKTKLRGWVNHPNKRTMNSVFSEYKSDFVSILRDYINFVDKYKLWEGSIEQAQGITIPIRVL